MLFYFLSLFFPAFPLLLIFFLTKKNFSRILFTCAWKNKSMLSIVSFTFFIKTFFSRLELLKKLSKINKKKFVTNVIDLFLITLDSNVINSITIYSIYVCTLVSLHLLLYYFIKWIHKNIKRERFFLTRINIFHNFTRLKCTANWFPFQFSHIHSPVFHIYLYIWVFCRIWVVCVRVMYVSRDVWKMKLNR